MAQKVEVEEGVEQLEALEEKILRVVDLLHETRSEKDELAQENTTLRRKLAEQEHAARLLQDKLGRIEKERENVKARVQKILEQVDTLTQAATDAD